MKTTKKEFEEFKEEFIKYQEKFGLLDWKVSFEHTSLYGDRFAEIQSCLDGRVSVVRFNTKNPCKCNPKESAKHEAIHLLLATLSILGGYRYITSLQKEEAEEGIVRTLEKLL